MDYGRKAVNNFRQQMHVQQAAEASAVAALVMPASVDVPAPQQGQQSVYDFFQPAPLTVAQQQHNARAQQHREQLAEQVILQLQSRAAQQQQEAAALLQQAQQMVVAELWKLIAEFVILNP